MFDVETKALAKLAQPGADFYGIHASNDGKVMIFAGGVPIKKGETVIGAVGVSGGTGKQDQGVAEAARETSLHKPSRSKVSYWESSYGSDARTLYRPRKPDEHAREQWLHLGLAGIRA